MTYEKAAMGCEKACFPCKYSIMTDSFDSRGLHSGGLSPISNS
jgi:hypothetical protein